MGATFSRLCCCCTNGGGRAFGRKHKRPLLGDGDEGDGRAELRAGASEIWAAKRAELQAEYGGDGNPSFMDDEEAKTALRNACGGGGSNDTNDDVEAVKRALGFRGAVFDINADLDSFGTTAVAWAAGKNRMECLRFLVSECGADPNVADYCGWTPLFRASYNGHDGPVEFLVEEGGADVNSKTVRDSDWAGMPKGSTPLDAATKEGNTEIASRLMSRGGKLGSELFFNG